MKIAARFSDVTLEIMPFCTHEGARPWRKSSKWDPILLVCLLHTGGPEILQDHLWK